jgi:hypothetical protein
MCNVQANRRTTLFTLRPTGCYIHFGIVCEEGGGGCVVVLRETKILPCSQSKLSVTGW